MTPLPSASRTRSRPSSPVSHVSLLARKARLSPALLSSWFRSVIPSPVCVTSAPSLPSSPGSTVISSFSAALSLFASLSAWWSISARTPSLRIISHPVLSPSERQISPAVRPHLSTAFQTAPPDSSLRRRAGSRLSAA